MAAFLPGLFLAGGGLLFLPGYGQALWYGQARQPGRYPGEDLEVLICSIRPGESGLELSGVLFPESSREKEILLQGSRESRLRVRVAVLQAIPPAWWIPVDPLPRVAELVLENRGGEEIATLSDPEDSSLPLVELLTEWGLFREASFQMVLPRRDSWYLQPGRYAVILDLSGDARPGGNVQGQSLRYTRQ
ncbi:hypothetical protein [Alkalispirochaeta americana]|nr:hypothetical protein [Alkalispirochaeta americana]